MTDPDAPEATSPDATQRLFAAWRLLSAPVDVGELERWLPTLALEVAEAHGASLGIFGPDGDFARVVSASAGDAGTGHGAQRPERLLRALRDEPDDTDGATAAGAGVRAGRVTDETGESEAFLVAPVVVRRSEHAWLCVSRPGDRFGAVEREALELLSGWAGLAIDNATLLSRAHAREAELVRAVRGLRASGAIAEAVSREPRLDLVLERIVEEALDLVGARTVLALLADGDELVVAAQAGAVARNVRGLRVPRDGTLLGRAMDHDSSHRTDDLTRRDLWGGADGMGGGSGLFVPMAFRGQALGVLAAIDRRGGDLRFTGEDERLLQSFAASAATAVASARSVAEDRMRRTVEATEQERRRWARELHDETLQGLGLLRIGLSAALAKPGADREAAMASAVDGLADEIERLRALINELRPAGLDELGLEPALQALVERTRRAATVRIDVTLTLGDGPRLPPDREVLAYRIVQEALSNVLKHAQARAVRVDVVRGDRGLEVLVTDDGFGFDPDERTTGVGLLGMRERVELAGGRLEITSQPGRGTQVAALVPDAPRPAA